jgi:hypothetical protein
MTWTRILRAVEELAGVSAPRQGRWSEIVESARAAKLFRSVDVLGMDDGIALVELDPSVDLVACAAAMSSLGPLLDMKIVSPPIHEPGRPGPAWDRRYSKCHEVGGRRVWFGLEEVDSVKSLRSIAIHYDDDAPIPDALPASGQEAPATFTVSTGWCGGHGEAVLDGDARIRSLGGLPIYLDDAGWRLIRDRVNLSGAWRDAPVVRVTGRVRLEKREERNESIPGAPTERYVALIVTALEDAQVIGEGVDDT